MNLRLGLCCLIVTSGAALAQSVTVYSEFAQIDESGRVTSPENPREILSPALVRNGFTSFQVVVQAPSNKEWWLFVGENPENLLKITLYQESPYRGSNNALQPVDLPHKSTGTEVLWMDVWTPAAAPIARVKVEPELYIDDDWVTYPMEGRVVEARVPELGSASALCPAAESSSPLARLERRNAAQDFALATPLPQDERNKLLEFCDRPAPSRWSENYLRIRDYLFRLR